AVPCGAPVPERFPPPGPGSLVRLERPDPDVVALRDPRRRLLPHRFLRRRQRRPPEHRVELPFPVDAPDPPYPEVRKRPRMQRAELAGEGHLLAFEDDGGGAGGLIARRLRLHRGTVLAVLPLQGEELLVAVAAQLLEERRAPPPR